jgi:signal transduction histidine kinase
MTVQAREQPDLAALLTRLDELRHTERRAASARMVSMIGHLIGTPLNVIAGRAGLIRTNPSPEGIDENVRRIEEQVERLSLRIRRLIDYFSMDESKVEACTVQDLSTECVMLYEPVAELKGVKLETTSSAAGTLRLDGWLGPLLLTTLLSLAVRSAQSGQTVRLCIAEREPRALSFDFVMPGLMPPPGPVDRLEPPEYGVHYDASALETLWICNALSRRIGGALVVTPMEGGSGVDVCVTCNQV